MTKEELLVAIKAKFANTDHALDDHVHDAKAGEGSAINNEGLEAQFEYLYEANGHEFLESLLS
jgi:hypothetical protein